MKVSNFIFNTFLAISLLVSFAFTPNLAFASNTNESVQIQFDCDEYVGLMGLYRATDAQGILPAEDWECDPEWISEDTSYENACNIMSVSPSDAIYIIMFGMKTKSKSCSY